MRGRALSSRKDRRTNEERERESERVKERARKGKNTEKKAERKDYRGARYLGEGDRARGDERWLYKTRLEGEDGERGRETRGRWRHATILSDRVNLLAS